MKTRPRIPGLVLLCFLTLAPSACAPDGRKAEASEPPASPRLAALRERLAAGDKDAVERFWEEVEKTGTPLLEPIPGDDERLLVTFVWRGGWRTRRVVVLGTVANKAEMARLPESDVWYWSTPVRKDARFTYRFASNADREDPRLDPLNRRPYPPAEPLLSLVEMPEAAPQPWVEQRPGVPRGKVADEGMIHSAVLQGDREMRVYTPAGYRREGEPYRLLLVFDGLAYIGLVPLPTILDNLIAEGEIPGRSPRSWPPSWTGWTRTTARATWRAPSGSAAFWSGRSFPGFARDTTSRPIRRGRSSWAPAWAA